MPEYVYVSIYMVSNSNYKYGLVDQQGCVDYTDRLVNNNSGFE